MAQISALTMADATARDARTDWEAGDIVFLLDPGVLTVYDGEDWVVLSVEGHTHA